MSHLALEQHTPGEQLLWIRHWFVILFLSALNKPNVQHSLLQKDSDLVTSCLRKEGTGQCLCFNSMAEAQEALVGAGSVSSTGWGT